MDLDELIAQVKDAAEEVYSALGDGREEAHLRAGDGGGIPTPEDLLQDGGLH